MLSASIAWAQDFPLGEFDAAWFDEPNENGHDLHSYLMDHFDGITQKIQNYHPYPNDSKPCKYGLSVPGGIYLDVNNCEEEGGGQSTLFLPGTTSEEELKAWIEAWHEKEDSGENRWDGNNYEPIEGGAGCYYSIEKDQYGRYKVEIYCGC